MGGILFSALNLKLFRLWLLTRLLKLEALGVTACISPL